MNGSNRNLKTRALEALCQALRRYKPRVDLDNDCRTKDLADNLIEGVQLEDFAEDLGAGNGGELKAGNGKRPKFHSAYSSAALTVNNFAPFKKKCGSLSLVGMSGFDPPNFEGKCPIFLDRDDRTPPNLDLVADGPGGIVAIESKLTEFLNRPKVVFADAYCEIKDSRCNGPWFKEMHRLKHEKDYTSLDAAQLIKHAFGLEATYRGRQAVLLYLFWEPLNANQFEKFTRHQDELRVFSERVRGGFPAFQAMSYTKLWRLWEDGPDWLRVHGQRVRARYELAI